LTGFTLAFAFRGPKNAIPGTIMFALFGYGGQRAYDFLDRRNSETVRKEVERRAEGKPEEKEMLMHRIAKSKWSPMSIMTDEEYEKVLGERLLRVETDIALIDDRIKELRKQQMEERVEEKKK
jgi:hypothetical protein